MDELLKTMHSSLCIRFGTAAPFAIGAPYGERVGFANIPCVAVIVDCRPADVPALVPIVRQRVYGELAERGWSADDVEFSPTVQQRRRRRFTDANESSETFGAHKFGHEHRFTFEMTARELRRAMFAAGTFAPLPEASRA